MKKIVITLAVLSVFAGNKAFSQTYKVLFIGNSYTYSYNMPGILASLADASGDTIIHLSSTPGGHTFEQHVVNQTTISYINSDDWDFAVLQEQSQRPSFAPWQVVQEVYPYAVKLDSMIKENNSCTETMFYMTWGRKYGDSQNCQFYPPICTYDGMQERLRTSYLEMANTNGASCAPVGMAWANSIETDSLFELYQSDYSHPNYAGSYLTACVFYASIFRESPVGINFYGSLDSTTATYLQNIAAETVLDSMVTWRIGANDVVADFDHDFVGDTMFLHSTSSNADQWEWTFDGANMEQGENPYYILNSANDYEVTLVASSDCGSDTVTQNIHFEPLAIGEKKSARLEVYPNPNDGFFKVNHAGGNSLVDIRICDITGRLVHSEQIKSTETITVGYLKKGTYLVTLEEGGVQYNSKMVIR